MEQKHLMWVFAVQELDPTIVFLLITQLIHLKRTLVSFFLFFPFEIQNS